MRRAIDMGKKQKLNSISCLEFGFGFGGEG